MKTLAKTILALTLTVAAAAHAEAPAKTAHGALTTMAGMTLYTFDSDSADKSACYGPCAANWPPLLAQDNDVASGNYGLIVRDDGKKQWTYKGKPLYQFAKDKIPGDKVGDGFKNVWHVAAP